MVGFGAWIDAHGHLADPRWDGQHDDVILQARSKGIKYFMQGGVDPSDWQRQRDLAARFPGHIGLCFGLHPYWVAANDAEACEAALDLLAAQLGEAAAIGEMGLDFRPHIMKDSADLQFTIFEQQIELAHISQKPIVLHIVQAHEEALRVFDLWGVPKAKGLVHSFNGSAKKAEEFLSRGLYLSVGGPVCRPDNQKLHQAVKEIPLEFLLIESDTPDQAPPAFKGQLNPPESIWEVAKTVAEIKSLDPLEILDITTENFRRLFPVMR